MKKVDVNSCKFVTREMEVYIGKAIYHLHKSLNIWLTL